VHFTFCFLLMIACDTHGFTSLEEKVMFSSTLRNSEPWWKRRKENPSKSFVHIKGGSINQGTSSFISKIMEYYNSL
jgi:hypothetical protein